MIPGVSGQLLSHAFLDRQFLPSLLNGPDAAQAVELTRRLERWWRRASHDLGPASASRAVVDAAVVPLLDLLGLPPPVMRAEEWGHTGVTTTQQPPLLIVAAPWSTTIDQAWQRATRALRIDAARWAIVCNGHSLRLVDCGRPWARLSIEFQFATLLTDPRGGIVFAALTMPVVLDGAREHPTSLAAIVDRSAAYSSGICRALGRGVLTALHGLTTALVAEAAPATARSPTLVAVFEQSLTLVYRVLFLLFAEARGLVPVWHETYREAYTIDSLCRRIGERSTTLGLWGALQAISRMAHSGCRAGDLEVTAFNGRLFSPAYAPLVERRRLSDEVARDVVMALATVETGSGRSRIAFHDLGVEQLGAVYEQVLDYQIEPARSAVVLRATSTERKTSGSFYTPRSVTEFLVRRTLHPLVDGRSADEILSLRVVDPAMGSGAFLVAACQFLADQCEQALVRDGTWSSNDVTPAERASLRRMVAERCLYGVDRNPTAVQLARLSLWLTTLAKDRPLTFLDHHLAAGDSLLGGRLSDLGRPFSYRRSQTRWPGVPVLPMFDEDVAGTVAERVLPERVRLALDPSNSPDDVRDKERRLAALKSPEGPFSKWSTALDVWCAIHAWARDAPSPALAAELIRAGLGAETTLSRSQLEPWLADAAGIARARQAFHWEIEFPEVFFEPNGRLHENGGFDAVIGNPPWDVLRADTGSASSRVDDRSRTAALLRFFRESGVYRHQGHGHPNSYQLFVERTIQLLRAGGRFGLIVPSGLAADHGSAALRRRLLERTTIDTWLGFTNRAAIFPIHRSVRFILLAGSNAGSTERLSYRCRLSDAATLERRPSSAREESDDRLISIARSRLASWDPEHLTIPDITSPEALAIVTHLCAGAPPLGLRDGWGATFGRELNATDDREHFRAARDARGRVLPVVEGKHVSPFTVSLDDVDRVIPIDAAARLIDPASSFERTRLAYRDVASATNRLTLIAALLPRHTISTHTVFCLKTRLSLADQWCLLALLNSLVANFLIRLRVTTHVTATLMSRLPVPRPSADSASHRQLVSLARRLARTGIEGGQDAYTQLNARVAALYQLSVEDYESIVGTFPLMPEEIRAQCVNCYRELRDQ